jgi:hypothetical protein
MVNSRGFIGRRAAWKNALTPGQYVTEDFPVLSADPTPHVPLEQWEFTIEGEDALRRRDWRAFASCRPAHPTDIHCVTGWPKLNTLWKGVSLDTFLNKVSGRAATGPRSGLLLSGRFRLDEAFRIERDTAVQPSGIRLGPGHQEDVLDWTNHAVTSNPRDLVSGVERVVSVNIVTCSRPDVRAERRHALRRRRQQPNTS